MPGEHHEGTLILTGSGNESTPDPTPEPEDEN